MGLQTARYLSVARAIVRYMLQDIAIFWKQLVGWANLVRLSQFLDREPDVREDLYVELGVDVEYLDDGVVPDADENDDDVEHGQSQQQWAEVGSHLRLPGNVNLKFDFWAFINSIFSIFFKFQMKFKIVELTVK